MLKVSEKRSKFMELKMVMQDIHKKARTIHNLEQREIQSMEQQLKDEKRIERLEGQITVYEEWRKTICSELKARDVEVPDSVDEINEYLNENPVRPKTPEVPDFDLQSEV